MSSSDGGGPGRREVAVRCFAAEYDDAELEYSESDEERAPNYVVTPTGARVNRLFVVGVLTEVESVSDDVLRGRVVDPTGAFVIYAGQYQPDAKTFLERADPPQFVAVTGKARTFRPDDGDRVFTSVRPESINAVDAETRDRWTVQTAEHTVDRVATCAAALEREERGEALEAALLGSGVDPALAAGIPRAIDHYGTTPAYLAAVRTLAIEAAEVVAGEREEVEALATAPDEGSAVEVDLSGDVVVEAATGRESPSEGAGAAETAGSIEDDAPVAEPPSSEAGSASTADPAADEDAIDADDGDVEPDDGGGATAGEDGATEPADTAEADDDGTAESATGADANADDLGDFQSNDADEPGAATGSESAGEGAEAAGADGAATADSTTDEPASDPDEMYEVDEDERQQIEEEYGTDFTTGSEVAEPGEAGIETPGPEDDETPGGAEADEEVATAAEEEAATEADEEVATAAEEEAATEADEEAAPVADDDATPESDESDAATTEDEAADEATADAGEAPTDADESASEPAGDVGLEDAVVETMAELDDGDGAEREAVVAAVVDARGADPGAVEDAIEDALMGGRCYEPQDDRFKAI